MAYTKAWAIAFISLFVVVGLLVNFYPYVKRDPAEAFIGVATNLFSPCIVIDEGSKFLVRSSVLATLLHCLNLVLLVSLVVSGNGFLPIANQPHPPLIHCFGKYNLFEQYYSFEVLTWCYM